MIKQAANLEVVSISASQESQADYRNGGAQIVLERNSLTNEYAVYRYWVASEAGGELRVAKLFSSQVYAYISSMHVVSDEYALAVVSNDAQDLTKNEIKVIYFSEFQGSQVPFNYGITVL